MCICVHVYVYECCVYTHKYIHNTHIYATWPKEDRSLREKKQQKDPFLFLNTLNIKDVNQ